MPPWAAILCARRGESWKQKHRTLYPNSPSEAAAAPPARPVPTTIIVCFRLFAGLTSLRLKRWRSQRVSIGPSGDFESSSISGVPLQMQQTSHHRDGYRAVSDRDQDGDDGRALLQQGGVAWMVDAHGLEHAPQSVVQMHAQQDHRENVECGDPVILKAQDNVAVHVGSIHPDLRSRQPRHCSHGQMQHMEDDEGRDDGSAPEHGAGGIRSRNIILLYILDRPGGTILTPEL